MAEMMSAFLFVNAAMTLSLKMNVKKKKNSDQRENPFSVMGDLNLQSMASPFSG